MVASDAPAESVEERCGEFVATFEYDDLPQEAVESIVRAYVDTVGVAIAGTETDVGRSAAKQFADDSPTGDSLYIGAIAHALDYDDLSWGIDGHPSVVLVPPVLALAKRREITGRDAITAYAAGFETACAVAGPISPDHYERGWHATATFGVFAATAASAHALELDAPQVRSALNIAASTAAGLKRNFGSMTKPLHAGFASRSGVTAAQLAADDVTADAAAITGDGGFWDLYGDPGTPDDHLGERLALVDDGIHTKMYPCCYFTHSSIAAAKNLVADNGLAVEDIEGVTVSASRGAADALQHPEPSNGLEAKFSMEYTVAAAIARGGVGLAEFEPPALSDDTIEHLRNRVSFAPDPALHYDSHEATVTIRTRSGSHKVTRTDPPGVHENPPTESELHAKFEECATRAISQHRSESIYDELAALPECTDVGTFSRVL